MKRDHNETDTVAAWDPRASTTGGVWTVESREAAVAGAPDFGRRFLARLLERFPALAPGAVYLRWSVQPEDVYAVLALPRGGFSVQIDPDLEYVIVWDGESRAEFGDWDGDQVEPALAFVAELVADPDRSTTDEVP